MPIHVKARHLLASAVVAGIFALPAYAQQSSPSEISQASVAEILKNPVDDHEVQMQGHLLRQAEYDKYIFSDGTGEIVAQIKSTRFPGLSFDAATKIALIGELIGEVDTRSKLPPEIEVKSVRVIE